MNYADVVLNWPILIISFGYFVLMNNHFGWNADPKSKDEVICDGIGFIILALAFV